MGRALRVMLPGLAVLLLVTSAATAQVGSTAQITGTVRDTSGAVLPGVDVTAIQTDTGFRRSTTADRQLNMRPPYISPRTAASQVATSLTVATRSGSEDSLRAT